MSSVAVAGLKRGISARYLFPCRSASIIHRLKRHTVLVQQGGLVLGTYIDASISPTPQSSHLSRQIQKTYQ